MCNAWSEAGKQLQGKSSALAGAFTEVARRGASELPVLTGQMQGQATQLSAFAAVRGRPMKELNYAAISFHIHTRAHSPSPPTFHRA
jgi:hypothetical protein